MKKIFSLLMALGVFFCSYAAEKKTEKKAAEKFETVKYVPREDGTPVLNCSSKAAFERSIFEVAASLPDADLVPFFLALRGMAAVAEKPANLANKTGREIIELARTGSSAKPYQEAIDEFNKQSDFEREEIIASLRERIEMTLNPPEPAELEWVVGFDKAAKLATEQKKLIFALFTGSDWCPWCVKLNRELLATKEFKEYADKHFVLLLVDFPRGGNQSEEVKAANADLSEKYDVSGFPTIKILSPDGKVLASLGYRRSSVGSYIRSIEQALAKK